MRSMTFRLPLLVSFVAVPLGCSLDQDRLRQVADAARSEATPLLARVAATEHDQLEPQTVVSPSLTLTLLNQRICRPETLELKAGQANLGVEVRLEALQDFGVPVNRYYARLEDADGRRYPALLLEGCDPRLESEPLRRRETARGWLSFVIPENRRQFALVYEPRLADGQTEHLALEIRY